MEMDINFQLKKMPQFKLIASRRNAFLHGALGQERLSWNKGNGVAGDAGGKIIGLFLRYFFIFIFWKVEGRIEKKKDMAHGWRGELKKKGGWGS